MSASLDNSVGVEAAIRALWKQHQRNRRIVAFGDHGTGESSCKSAIISRRNCRQIVAVIGAVVVRSA